MADIAKIKRNIKRMIDQSAPESDIDAYIASEGVTAEQLRASPIKADMFAPTQKKTDREMSWGETAVDAAKSLGTGVEQGIIGMAGMAGDIPKLAGKGFGYAFDTLSGATPEQRSANQASFDQNFDNGALGYLTSDAITKGVEGITGPMYQPKTTTGEVFNTVGNFIPGIATGPMGTAKQAIKTVARNVIAPAAGSELGGAVAGAYNPDYAGYGKIAGAVLGGGLGSMERGGKNAKAMREAAPDYATVKSAETAAYKALDDGGIVFDGKAYRSAAMKMQTALRKKGLRVGGGGDMEPYLKEIIDRMKKVNGFTEVEGMRQDINAILPKLEGRNQVHAQILRKGLDDLLKTGALYSSKGIKQADIAPMIDKARELASRRITADKVIEMRRAAEEGYKSGVDSGAGNQFGAFLRNPKKSKYLSDEERAAFKRVKDREGWKNTVYMSNSRIGQPVSRGFGSTIGGGTGFMLGGLPGGAIGTVVGGLASDALTAGSRALMDKIARKEMEDALKTVLAGKPAQKAATKADRAATVAAKNKALVETSKSAAIATSTKDANSRGSMQPFYRDAHGRWWTRDGLLLNN